MQADFPFEVVRPWGSFRQFTKDASSTVKIITVKPNETLSLQSHERRSEFEHVISGAGFLRIGDEMHEVKAGDEYEVPVGVKHQMSAGPEGLQFLEISSGAFDEEDITRFEDKYGRA
jgi:mannose-6-phosphate isomerase-like protein (cupin superfamily)